jgi:hypothetical protein
LSTNAKANCNALRFALSESGPGPIRDEEVGKIVGLLADCWTNLSGSDEQSTSPDKLWRAEDLKWNPPELTFQLERHGGTVQGSTRAELHFWTIDVDEKSARVAPGRFRQLNKAAPRLDLSPLCVRVRELVINHCEDAWLDWKSADRAVLRIGEIVGGEFEQTRASRRKRFRKKLQEIVGPDGWQVVMLPGSRTVIERIKSGR